MSKRVCLMGVATVCLVVSAAGLAQGRPEVGVLESYRTARVLLDAAIEAHGGLEAVNGARQMRVQAEGTDVWRNQSRGADAPYDREPRTEDLMVDLAAGRLVSEGHLTFPGGAHVAVRWVTDGPRGFVINPRAQTYSPRQFPAADTQTGNLYLLPQFMLIKARENANGLRALGRLRLSHGAEVDVITTSTPSGPLTLGFDPETRHLRASLGVAADAVAGDSPTETEFVGYRMLNGVLLPTRRISRIDGEVTRDLAYVAVTPRFSIPDDLASPPAEFVAEGALVAEPVRTLADGVWLLGGNSSALAVEFRDHVIVVDAPPSGAAGAIAKLAELAPGKPIRFVIPTHHHDDHSTGVRRYAASGATIVTTPGNVAFFQRLMTARTTFGADALPPRTPKIETIDNRRRVFTDGVRSVEIHDIGAGPHASEMLVAWLPAEGILFQADLIGAPSNGSIPRGTNNETTIHFTEWLRKQAWTVKVFAGTHSTLPNTAVFDALVKQPLLPRR